MRAGLAAALVAVCFGCGGDEGGGSGGLDAGGGADAARADAGGGGLDGMLTVHTGYKLASGELRRVMLDDGKVFNVEPDFHGTAVFEDPSLRGPQDVTVVYASAPSWVQVVTILQVDQPEIWVNPVRPSSVDEWSISGTVTGGSDGEGILVRAVGPDLYGSELADEVTGEFFLRVKGPAPGTVDVYAHEGGTDGAVAVGAALDVPLGDQVQNRDIALDVPLDQSVEVSLVGEVPFGGGQEATLIFHGHDNPVFYSEVQTTEFPVSVPSPSMDPPLDRLGRMVLVHTGSAAPGSREVQWSFVDVPAGVSSVELEVPAPPTWTSPPVGALDEQATASASGLEMTWSNPDPKAKIMSLHLIATDPVPEEGILEWTVYAPASHPGFTFFPLPEDAGPLRTFPPGPYQVTFHQLAFTALDSPTDIWTSPRSFEPALGARRPTYMHSGAEHHDLRLRGWITLQ